MNLIVSYRCPPNSRVADELSTTAQYWKYLRSIAGPETGSVSLPGRLLGWVNANGGETIARTTSSLRLDCSQWDRVPTWVKAASYQRYVYLHIHIDD